MSTRVIPVEVNDEYFSGAGLVAGAAGSANDVILRAHFGAMWDGLSKYATFRDAHGENPVVVSLALTMLVEGTTDTYDVPVPSEAKAIAGLMSVSFTGYEIVNGNEVSTVTNTAEGKMRVLPSDAVPFDDGSITPSIAEQFRAEIDTLKDDVGGAGEYARQAAASAEAAQDAASGITGMTVSAEGGDEADVVKSGGMGGVPVNLHFTLPRGAAGARGADGAGFDNLTTLTENAAGGITVGNTGIAVLKSMTAQTSGGNFSFMDNENIPLTAGGGIAFAVQHNAGSTVYWVSTSLAGIDEATVGYVPVKAASGGIQWVPQTGGSAQYVELTGITVSTPLNFTQEQMDIITASDENGFKVKTSDHPEYQIVMRLAGKDVNTAGYIYLGYSSAANKFYKLGLTPSMKMGTLTEVTL